MFTSVIDEFSFDEERPPQVLEHLRRSDQTTNLHTQEAEMANGNLDQRRGADKCPSFSTIPSGVAAIASADLHPKILTADGEHLSRLFKRPELRQGGLYLAIWQDGDELALYVGQSSARVVNRLRSQVYAYPRRVDRMVVITEATDRLDDQDLLVLERLLHQQYARSLGCRVVNPMPCGGVVSDTRYAVLRGFLGDVSLCLRRVGLGLSDLTDAALITGPIHEPSSIMIGSQKLAAHRFSLEASGVMSELLETNTGFFVMPGSVVKVRDGTISRRRNAVLRQELLFSGGIEPIGGDLHHLNHAVAFQSASAAASFVLDNAGGSPSLWVGRDPDGPSAPQRIVIGVPKPPLPKPGEEASSSVVTPSAEPASPRKSDDSDDLLVGGAHV